MDLSIIYEDTDLLVIYKPSGLVVHPGSGNFENTLVHGLLYYLKSLPTVDDETRPGIVHRLDKETSGVMLIAKTALMHRKLVDLFKERKIEKTYHALCKGHPKEGVLQTYITRHPKDRRKMAVSYEGGKEAITEISLLETTSKYSFVKVQPKTGRTHQIRVHLSHLHTPILGDKAYNPHVKEEEILCLHAYRIVFCHPLLDKEMTFTAPHPTHFRERAHSLGLSSINAFAL